MYFLAYFLMGASNNDIMSYASFFVAWLKCIYYLLLFKTGLPRAIERMATAHMWSSFSALKFDRKKSVSLQTN